jgi:hypothetical protein
MRQRAPALSVAEAAAAASESHIAAASFNAPAYFRARDQNFVAILTIVNSAPRSQRNFHCSLTGRWREPCYGPRREAISDAFNSDAKRGSREMY